MRGTWTCQRCARRWPSQARWCGRCGDALTQPDVQSFLRGVPGRRRYPQRAVADATAVLATCLLVATALLGGGRIAGTGEVALQDPPPQPVAAADPLAATVETTLAGPPCRQQLAVVPCVVWDVPSPASDRRAVRLVGHLVVTVARDGTVTAREVTDGTTTWTAAVGPPTPSDLVVRILDPVRDALPIQVGGRLWFLSAVDGRTLWHGEPPVAPVSAARAGAWLVVGDGRHLTNLDPAGGSTWQLDLPGGTTAYTTVHGLYLGGPDGVLERLSADGGGPAWRLDLGAPARPLSVTAGDTVGLFGVDGHDPALLAIEPRSGHVQLRWELDGTVLAAVAHRQRYVALADGPRGVEVHLAGRTADGDLVRTGRRRLGVAAAQLRGTATAGGQLAVAATGPRPSITVVGPDPRRAVHHALAVPPRAVAFHGSATLVVVTADAVDAIDAISGVLRWRVGLREATLLGEEPWQPPVVAHRDGLTRLTVTPAAAAGPASPPPSPLRSPGQVRSTEER